METQDMETIEGRLRSLRMNSGLTQQELAEEFGLKILYYQYMSLVSGMFPRMS